MISRSAAHLEREFERQVLFALDRAVEQASKMCAEMEDELMGTTVHGPSIEHSSDRIEQAADRSAASTAKTVMASEAAHVRAKQVDAQAGGKQKDTEAVLEAVQGLPAAGSLAYTQTGVVSPRYRSPHKVVRGDTTPAAPRSAMMEAFCNARGPGWGRDAIGRLPSSSLVQLSDVGNLNPSLLPELPKISAPAERASLAHARGKEEGAADLDQDFRVSGFLRAQFRKWTDILILLVRERDHKLALLFDEAALLNHDL